MKIFFSEWGNFRIDDGQVHLEHGIWIEKNTLVHAVDGVITIGSRTFINQGSMIVCRGHINIGNDVLIGDHVSIYDHDHNIRKSKAAVQYGKSGYTIRNIEIGDNAWIGSHSVILKGVSIGKNSIIGAGSVVVTDVPENEIWAGVPARLIRKHELTNNP